MQLPVITEVRGMRVLSTKQIADAYGTTKDKIIYNFNYNKSRYTLGKHYIEVSGDELRRLKTTCENQMSFKYAKSLYLWTEKGALLHAKSLNTDKAWEVYDYQVDFYFRAKEERKVPVTVQDKPAPKRVSRRIAAVKDAEICEATQKIRNDLTCMDVLLQNCLDVKWESEYQQHRSTAMDIMSVIAKDFIVLANLSPTVIEEKYY